ncbi:DNA-binding protein [Paenarthrobacter sp. Z7-10]|uniref:DNA-binding protein n=1 Tax=Paenarthrobacter sp. Z7-10 TaxID=2787635 RepID=UPI0022A962AA|nr:DNA-binding protein [Paenarthrobacter sp. Z7-10]MCZ2404715.1 DNA-binding protein [Paenarthrobacter sp. Z7-10]
MAEQQTPEQRAGEAAEALAAGGTAVTARAVRERSGVRMSVAVEVARTWNDREAQAEAVPAPPAAVEARFVALWREAVAVARGEFVEARTGWQATVERAQAERDAAVEDVERAEAERDALAERLEDAGRLHASAYEALTTARDEARAETVAAREQAASAETRSREALAEQRSRADKAEARAEAVAGERDRLLAERDGLRDANRRQKG